MEKYRTFIAVPIRVEGEFLQARNVLMDRLSAERISWVDPERYHVTIRFLGDTPVESLDAIVQALESRLEMPGSGELGLDFNHLESFGPRKKPRVAWVGFKDDFLFNKLKTEVDAALELCGIPPVDQPFRAHLTLGRIRSLKDLQGYYEVIDSMNDQFSVKAVADRLVYYRSELGFGAPLYTRIAEWLFTNQFF